ncbi:hypothetical protein AK812_SmicGene40683 [Symbiodinium microadriaticum]|uniref:EGF-like domain-containing protein n=1 Tax=Symbiodinium microadriaticum TaxID=2951 RepID=A0A1Q9C830_SYMMI|nr:hypothetical protein AK812_SmicGene40683 [Symbiodinium microadriaticum]
MNWLVFFALLEAALAGSGCNEVVQDLGPWVDSASVEKTEEGFSLSLVLVGGDVAASSTESVELLIGRQADGHTRHFVLPKAAARKGGILEIRTEEDLLGGVGDGSFSMQATLAEVNGNNHGPESLSCRREAGRSACRRTEKKSPAGVSPSSMAGEGGHMMRGSGAGTQGADGPRREGMHQGMHQGPMPIPSQSPSQSSMLWTKPPRGECHPNSAPCPAGSACKASGDGSYICVKAEGEKNLRRSFENPSSGHGFQMMVAAALFVCLSCLCGALFLHRFGRTPGARNVDSVPKVMGKLADGNLSTVQTMTRSRAFENDSDSDDDLRVW